MWEFPGGKVEPNEDEMEAIEREIKEEFEINIKAIEYLINNVCIYPNKTVDLRLYECIYIYQVILFYMIIQSINLLVLKKY